MRSGCKKVNKLGKASYESFCPSRLQDVEKEIKISEELSKLIIDLHELFARIDSMSSYISNVDIFLYTYILKEALESSRIEGTECTMQNLLDTNNLENAKNIDDINETIANVRAINKAIDLIKTLPISTRIYKQIHIELMKNVRGKDKNPGEIRTTQNWVGGKDILSARYIPPNVEDMNDALSNLDQYINDNSNADIFVRTALIHYQFETIHPFLDGNGRLGRILIIIFLIVNKVISKPMIYVSYFLKINQLEYYDKLMKVREKDMYEEYILFFLMCLKDTCNSTINKMVSLNNLHDANVNKLYKSNREKETLKMLFDYIEKNPIIDIPLTASKLKLSYNTIHTNILKLIDLGILNKSNDSKRNKIYTYTDYIDILVAE